MTDIHLNGIMDKIIERKTIEKEIVGNIGVAKRVTDGEKVAHCSCTNGLLRVTRIRVGVNGNHTRY